MSISFEEVQHVARLARLDLDESELLAFQSELNALLGHFGDIEQVSFEGAETFANVVELQNVWSDDRVEPGLSREQALSNAAVTKAGLFLVPTIIED